VLVAMPEISRPLAEYRMLVYGLLLILVINYMPRGIVDTWIDFLRQRNRAKSSGQPLKALP
jgi:branched-chain amino acid transport system permease protein